MRTESPPVVLAERPDFLVVDKPPHLLSHPTRPDGAPTLLGWLQARYPGEFVALANRLDRETSGTVLVARSPEVASRLGAMTMRREIVKHYLALVSGRVEQEHGMIDAPIGRLGISEANPIWVRQGVIPKDDPPGRKTADARTEFWRLEAGGACSLLRLRAHTGRLHQLRVHLAHIGHPVIGDKIYGPDPNLYLKFIAEGWTAEHQHVLGLPRHALHAHELRFAWDGEQLTFTASLPDDIRNYAAGKVSLPASLSESSHGGRQHRSSNKSPTHRGKKLPSGALLRPIRRSPSDLQGIFVSLGSGPRLFAGRSASNSQGNL